MGADATTPSTVLVIVLTELVRAFVVAGMVSVCHCPSCPKKRTNVPVVVTWTFAPFGNNAIIWAAVNVSSSDETSIEIVLASFRVKTSVAVAVLGF